MHAQQPDGVKSIFFLDFERGGDMPFQFHVLRLSPGRTALCKRPSEHPEGQSGRLVQSLSTNIKLPAKVVLTYSRIDIMVKV